MAMSKAAIPAASCRPSVAPATTAAIRLPERADRSSGGTVDNVSGVCVSGQRTLAITTPAGIASKEAESRCPAIRGNTSCKKATYSPSVLEATLHIPVVSNISSSDFVIRSRYGRTTSADSIPTKICDAP
jgi:hypothetical protein